MSPMGSLGPRARPGSVRTEIRCDDGGILKVYHVGDQATGAQVVKSEEGRDFGVRRLQCLSVPVCHVYTFQAGNLRAGSQLSSLV